MLATIIKLKSVAKMMQKTAFLSVFEQFLASKLKPKTLNHRTAAPSLPDIRRATHVFGMPGYPAKVYVVGLRTGGVWHIYAQCVAGANGPITNSLMIV
jgi:hypothetical protein